MATDVILEAGATIDIAPYEAGLAKMVDETAASATGLKASFQSVAAADAAVSQSVQQMSVQTAASFANVRTGGVLAFDSLRAKVIETTAEVARLRAEILETNDSAKLEQLEAQLRRATQEMTAARTELRALRFESVETREKLDLMGDSLGIKIPGALGTLLGRLPLVQTAMAAAFQATVVAFFISMIGEAIEKIGEMATAMGGFSKAVEAAYDKAVEANSRMILKSLELKETLDKVAVIGTEGIVKYHRELKNSEEANERTVALWKEQTKALEAANEEVKKMSERLALGKTWIGTEGIINYEEELKKAEATANRISAVVEALDEKINKRPAELKTRGAEERVAELEQAIRNETAATETRKKLADSYVDYFMAGNKRLFTDGKINLDTETENERAALTQRLEIFRTYTNERIAEARREAAAHPGKNVQPEIEGLQTSLQQQELETRTKIEDIDAASDERRIAHANSVSLALAEASRKATDIEASNEESSARRKLAARQISIDQEAAILKDALAKRIAAEQDIQNEEIRIASQDPYKNQDKLIAANAALLALKKELNDKSDAIDEEAAAKKRELAIREQEEQLRFTRETANLTLEETRRTDDTRLRAHEITLSQWANAETAAINNWYAQQRSVLQSEAEFAARTFGQKSVEYQKALNEMRVLDERFAADSQRIDEKLAAQFQQTMNVISRSFSTAFDRMLTEHTRFNQVLVNFWNQMVQGWARMGLQIVAQYIQTLAQIVLQEALTALKINVIHTQSTSLRKATETLYDSFLQLLGIKKVSKATVEETQQTAAHSTGVAARTGADTAALTATTTAYTLANTQKSISDGLYTTEYVAGVTARALADNAAILEVGLHTSARDVAEVISLAAVGAAGAAAAAAPLGPAAMEAAAAAADALILAFVPQASVTAQKGAFLGEDTIVSAHKNETVLPPHLSLGFKNAIEAGAFKTPSISVPQALSSTAPPASNNTSNSNTASTKIFNIRPEINIHQGDSSSRMSHEDIASAVNIGIRRGLIKVGV